MNKSREQFESWFRRFGSEDECTNMLQLNSYGTNYLHPHADLAWIAWQASRAVAEVEIPEVEKWRSPEAVRAQRAMLVLVKQAITDAGLKVKGE
ncbi:hypothetical protein SNQ37_002049 [Cronobacter sakazakii]|nr:hypothetical protein [Cronobacter sakazakii]